MLHQAPFDDEIMVQTSLYLIMILLFAPSHEDFQIKPMIHIIQIELLIGHFTKEPWQQFN